MRSDLALYQIKCNAVAEFKSQAVHQQTPPSPSFLVNAAQIWEAPPRFLLCSLPALSLTSKKSMHNHSLVFSFSIPTKTFSAKKQQENPKTFPSKILCFVPGVALARKGTEMAKCHHQLAKSDELPVFCRCLLKVCLGTQPSPSCLLSP